MKKQVLLQLAALACVSSLSACNRAAHEEASAPAPVPSRTTVARADAAPTASPAPATRAVPRDAINDSIITARIKASLLADPGMTGTDVSVNTDRGVVSLTGIIKSAEQAAIASAHAQRQDGVMRVDNHLAVNLQ
jgi:hyperosmotically inducible periplasmic protein